MDFENCLIMGNHSEVRMASRGYALHLMLILALISWRQNGPDFCGCPTHPTCQVSCNQWYQTMAVFVELILSWPRILEEYLFVISYFRGCYRSGRYSFWDFFGELKTLDVLKNNTNIICMSSKNIHFLKKYQALAQKLGLPRQFEVLDVFGGKYIFWAPRTLIFCSIRVFIEVNKW